jgi:hypothetical protein
MEPTNDPAKDISEIRSMMEQSGKFLSLSGLSGVSAGIVALIGAGVAQWYQIEVAGEIPLGGLDQVRNAGVQTFFVIDAAMVFVIAVTLAVVFSVRMARRKGLPVWNAVARRMITELSLPLVTGAGLCLIMMAHGLFALLPALSLIFYGVALLGASKFTVRELRALGISEIVLGLVAAFAVRFGLFFWAAGFGVVHVVYGLVVHNRYDR